MNSLAHHPGSTDIDVLARTIYGEARGEYSRADGGLAALIAVGNVVMNRFTHPRQRYGKSVTEICQRPYQFSCWNARDPNRLLIEAVYPGDNKTFDVCLEVAEKVITGTWPDLTQGANHYHTVLLTPEPAWALGKRPMGRIGQHLFYKL